MRQKLNIAFTLAVIFSLLSNSLALAYVGTNLPDYAPGSTVIFHGDNSDSAGFAADETVHVDVSGPNAYTCDATADANGAWSCQVKLLDGADTAGNYTYTAVGQTSNVSKSGAFTVTAVLPDPTAAPTAAPTVAPTDVPTVEPTLAPTDVPTLAPTLAPTDVPTLEPTIVPTDVPTEAPTVEPTIVPTDVPTEAPTEAPTVAPTSTPVSVTSIIVRMAAGLSANQQNQVIARNGGNETSAVAVLRLHFVDVPSDSLNTILASYRSDPQVISAELDKSRAVSGGPSDPSYINQWALPKIGWDSVYGSVTPNGSAVLAILDTGIDASHPDLTGLVLPGYSVFGTEPLTDPNGHGTSMAGIAAAHTNNGLGMAGVAYSGVKLLPVQVLGADGTGLDSDIITGIVWAVDNGANVILMSFSNPGYSPALQAAIDYAWSNGVVLVAATGNDGSSNPNYPAGDNGVMGVAATDASDMLDAGSNYGADVFLAAPGVNITATNPGGYGDVTGTSASAAMVAGAAAFMHAVDPSLSNAAIVGRLARNADPAGMAVQTGNGRLNFARALSDTSSDPVKPSGAAPVGNGGPFVGPYVVAALGITSLSPNSGPITGGTTVTITGTGFAPGQAPFAITFGGVAGTSVTRVDNTTITVITPPHAAGSVNVNVQDKGGAPGVTLTNGFTYNKAVLSVNAVAGSKTFGGADPTFTWSYTGFVGSDNAGNSSITGTASCSRTAGETVAGSPYKITCAPGTLLAPNYSFATGSTANFTIGKRAVEITADAKSKTYGDADPALTYQITNGSLVGSDAFTGSLTRAAGESVGTHAITQGTVALNSNYTLTYVGANLTISTRAVTITADAKSKTYGDGDPALTYQITSGSLAFSDAFTGSLTRAAGESVGTHAITQGTLSLNSNYALTFVGANLTISTRTVTVTADAKSKTYGDADPALTYQIASGSLVGSDAFTGSPTRAAGESVGTHAITQGTLSLSSNYALTFVGADLTITKRPVTITADVKSKTYGNADPALTYQITNGSLVGSDAFTGGLTRAAGEDVSAYAILQGSVELNGNYTLTYIGANLTIGKRAVEITADAKSKTYGDADPALTFQITSGTLAFHDAFTGGLTRAVGENVGLYAITQGTVALNGNYDLSYVGADLTIGKRPVTITADAKSKTYGDGDPALTYQITSGSLVGSDAFTGSLTRAAGESVGTHAITQGTLSLSSNYALTFVGADLTITKRPVTITADVKSKTYGNADPALTYQITSGTLAFHDAFTGELTRAVGENVGLYAITQGTVALNGNYDLSYVGADLTIGKRPVTITADAKSKTYGDADPALTYQITSGSLAFSDAFTGELTRAAGENVGDYAIQQNTVALNGNYTLTYVGANLTIGTRTVEITADAKNKTYGDADPALTYQITSGTLAFHDAFTGELTRDTGEHVADYAITQGTLSLNSNYALTYIGAKLTIGVKTINVTADAQSKIYGAGDPALTYIFTPALVSGDAFTGVLTRTAGEDVGQYDINQGTLALSTDYSLVYTGAKLTITQRAIQVTADSQTKVYGNSDPVLTYTYTGVLQFTDAFTGSLTRATGENVGTYAIGQGTLSLNGNYDLSYVGADLTITPATLMVKADHQTKVYGTADPSLTYKVTGLQFSDTEAAVLTGILARDPGETVAGGPYAINQGSLLANNNYVIAFTGNTLDITVATLTVKADHQSKLYGAADPTLSYVVTGLQFGDTEAAVLSGALARDAGETVAGGPYAITQGSLVANSNYVISFTGNTLDITMATLTVKADHQSKLYGAADPALTFVVSGLQFSDMEALVLSGALARDPGETVAGGPYAINQGSLVANSNYVISFTGNTLVIRPLTITVTADTQTKVYGSSDPALTYKFSPALVSGDSFSGALSRDPGEHIGDYQINQDTLALSSDYTLTYVGAKLSITPLTITVTADPKSKTYGDSDPALTYTFAPALVTGDNFSGALSRDAGEHVGQYDINQGTLALNTDYSLVYTGAKLTITQRAIQVTADSQTKVYGNSDPVLTYTYTGVLQFTDAFTGSLTRTTGENVGTYAIGQGTLALNGNYDLSYVGADLTITPATLMVKADHQSKVYGAADPALTYGVSGLQFSDTEALVLSGVLARASGETVVGGPYAITQGTLVADSNYSIDFTGNTLDITVATLTVTADSQSKVYGAADPALTFVVSGLQFSDMEALVLSGGLTRAPGETVAGSPYAITQGSLVANSNYVIFFTGNTLTITPKTASVTPNAASKTYGDIDPGFTGTLSGFLAADGVTAAYSRVAGETVLGGPYTISAELSPAGVLSNYDITYNTADFTIGTKIASVTPDALNKTYGAADPTLTGTLSGFMAADGVSAAYSRVAGETVLGSPYTISAVLSPADVLSNYDITYNTAGFTIGTKTASVTPDALSKTYGAADPTLTGTLSGFMAADGVSAAYSRVAGETVLGGPYTISATLSPADVLSNYTITYNTAGFTIGTKTASVTPDALSKTYGAADPTLTGTLSGFMAADGVSAAYSRVAGETVLGGPYTISAVLSPADVLSNYTITYNTANFKINPKTASVTPDALNKTYGDADPILTGTLTDFLSADGVTATYSRTAGETVLGGPYTISATLSPAGVLSNYDITYNTAGFTIGTKTASVTPDALNKTYGDADPILTGTLTDFLSADGVTATYSRIAGETVLGSPFTISATLSPTGVLSNYTITYNTANFKINPKTASVTPDALNKTYGDADPILTGTLTDFLSADGVTATYSRIAGETVLGSPYTISATLSPAGVLSNYTITYNTANFKINPKTASVTPDALNKTYGDADPILTGTLTDFLSADGVTATYSRIAGETVLGSPFTISATLSPAGVLSNYTITYNTANFKINPKAASVTPDALNKTYGDADPILTGTLTDFLSADGVTATYSRTAGETVSGGPYTISATLSQASVLSNYTITYNTANFTISPKAASVTPDAASKIYGAVDPTLTGTLSGFLAVDGVTAAYSRMAGETVSGGPYTISATLSPTGVLSNYTITYNTANFSITKRALTVTATGVNKVYDGTIAATVTLSDDRIAGDALTLTGNYTNASFADKNIGTSKPVSVSGISISGGAAGNYNLLNTTASTSASITPKTASVTPDVQSKTYSAIDPALTGTLAGFISGDGISATYSRNIGEAVGDYTISAVLSPAGALGNYTITYNTATFTINPGQLLSDITATDADFKRIDGFDVLFTKGSNTNYLKLKNTNPGTFHYQLTLDNETGVDVHDNMPLNFGNGATSTVILTVPALPSSVGTIIPSSTNGLTNPAFTVQGNHAIHVHPDDRTDDMPVTIQYALSAPSTSLIPTGDCSAVTAWTNSQPSDGTAVKCIRITGFSIPKKHHATIDVNYDFRIKNTDGWATNAQSIFRAGFSFKSTTMITLDQPLRNNPAGIYTGNQVAGIVGAGQQVTAVGGFVFDNYGNGVAGVAVKLFNSYVTGMSCNTPGAIATDTTSADGFYFIWKTGSDQAGGTTLLPSGVKYYQVVCYGPQMPTFASARYIDHKLANKEFDEEDYYIKLGQ